MADNASGFVDFQQFAGLNADDEARLFEQAMAEAEKATAAEKAALSRSEHDARGKFNIKDAVYEGGVDDISKTASYSDYLKAKRDAAAAWAKLGARSFDPKMAAVQGAAMSPEQRAALGASGGAAQSREDAAAKRAAGFFTGNETKRAGDIAARKKREEDYAQMMKDAKPDLATLIENAKKAARSGGTQVDYVGSYNPVASSNWAQQEGGRWVAQLREAGASEDAIRDVWNTWTGKGGDPNAGDFTQGGSYGNYPKKPGSGGQMDWAEGQWDPYFKKGG